MKLNPEIFKAYDIRGVYPQDIDEEGAKAIRRQAVAALAAAERVRAEVRRRLGLRV